MIPSILLKMMRKFKLKLHNSFKVLLSYGYLYKEYSKDCYYWEIIKIEQKTILNFFVIFYTDYVIIKGVLIVVILQLYYQITFEKKPFSAKIMNELDK